MQVSWAPQLSPMESRKKPVVIQPPVLRPQHVYAPVAPLGMLSLGMLSKHKKEARGGIREAEGEAAIHSCNQFITSKLVILTRKGRYF